MLTIKGIIHSFFTSFKVIKDSFDYLNKLPVFQLFRKLIRILSMLSLIFNLIIFGIFTQFSPLIWISSIPGISQIGAFVYESTPEKAQGFMTWIALKIKTFLLWIWNGLLDFIKAIIKTVLGEIENSPDVIDRKETYKDIYNEDYLNKLKTSFYDWRYWILGGFIIIGLGTLTYIYWDSISSCWRRGERDNGDEPFINQGFTPEVHGDENPLPSPSTSSNGSVNQFFRRNILDKVSSYKDKVKAYFKPKAAPTLTNIPRGIYQEGNRDMHNGMVLPRIETLENGTEYYINKDKDGFLQVLSNSFENSGSVDIVNPITGKTLSRMAISITERISLINNARNNAVYNSPENSFVRNPLFEGVNLMTISTPSSSSVSSSFIDKGKAIETAVELQDVDLTPRVKPSILPDYDIDDPFN